MEGAECQEEGRGQPPQSPALRGWEGVRGLLPELLSHRASPKVLQCMLDKKKSDVTGLLCIFKKLKYGNSLVIRWLEFHASNAWAQVQSQIG